MERHAGTSPAELLAAWALEHPDSGTVPVLSWRTRQWLKGLRKARREAMAAGIASGKIVELREGQLHTF